MIFFSEKQMQCVWSSTQRDAPWPFTEPVHVDLCDNHGAIPSPKPEKCTCLSWKFLAALMPTNWKWNKLMAFFCNGCKKWLFNFKSVEDFFIFYRFQTKEILSFQHIGIEHLILIIPREIHQNRSQDFYLPKCHREVVVTVTISSLGGLERSQARMSKELGVILRTRP